MANGITNDIAKEKYISTFNGKANSIAYSYCRWLQLTSITNGKEAGITKEIANTISYNLANVIAIRIANGISIGKVNSITN